MRCILPLWRPLWVRNYGYSKVVKIYKIFLFSSEATLYFTWNVCNAFDSSAVVLDRLLIFLAGVLSAFIPLLKWKNNTLKPKFKFKGSLPTIKSYSTVCFNLPSPTPSYLITIAPMLRGWQIVFLSSVKETFFRRPCGGCSAAAGLWCPGQHARRQLRVTADSGRLWRSCRASHAPLGTWSQHRGGMCYFSLAFVSSLFIIWKENT